MSRYRGRRFRIVEFVPRRYRVDEWKAGWFTGPRWRAVAPSWTPNGFCNPTEAQMWIDDQQFTPRVVREV